MNLNGFTIIISITLLHVAAKLTRHRNSDRLSGHSEVTESSVFPYAVAVLRKHAYMSAGALLDDKWVLTAADGLFLVRESTRLIRVRLGSINYKKGGVVRPVKVIEVHPYFDDTKPTYDLALIELASRVRLSPGLYPIRILTRPREVTATHFIVTAWNPSTVGDRTRVPMSIDAIKHRRMLSVSHLHPSFPDHCAEELASLDITKTDSIMCLDSDLKADPCWREVGAPVVLNGVLWGVISSWRPDDCYALPSSNFVTLVAAPGVRGWVRAVTRGQTWNSTVDDASRDELVEDAMGNDEETNEI